MTVESAAVPVVVTVPNADTGAARSHAMRTAVMESPTRSASGTRRNSGSGVRTPLAPLQLQQRAATAAATAHPHAHASPIPPTTMMHTATSAYGSSEFACDLQRLYPSLFGGSASPSPSPSPSALSPGASPPHPHPLVPSLRTTAQLEAWVAIKPTEVAATAAATTVTSQRLDGQTRQSSPLRTRSSAVTVTTVVQPVTMARQTAALQSTSTSPPLAHTGEMAMQRSLPMTVTVERVTRTAHNAGAQSRRQQQPTQAPRSPARPMPTTPTRSAANRLPQPSPVRSHQSTPVHSPQRSPQRAQASVIKRGSANAATKASNSLLEKFQRLVARNANDELLGNDGADVPASSAAQPTSHSRQPQQSSSPRESQRTAVHAGATSVLARPDSDSSHELPMQRDAHSTRRLSIDASSAPVGCATSQPAVATAAESSRSRATPAQSFHGDELATTPGAPQRPHTLGPLSSPAAEEEEGTVELRPLNEEPQPQDCPLQEQDHGTQLLPKESASSPTVGAAAPVAPAAVLGVPVAVVEALQRENEHDTALFTRVLSQAETNVAQLAAKQAETLARLDGEIERSNEERARARAEQRTTIRRLQAHKRAETAWTESLSAAHTELRQVQSAQQEAAAAAVHAQQRLQFEVESVRSVLAPVAAAHHFEFSPAAAASASAADPTRELLAHLEGLLARCDADREGAWQRCRDQEQRAAEQGHAVVQLRGQLELEQGQAARAAAEHQLSLETQQRRHAAEVAALRADGQSAESLLHKQRLFYEQSSREWKEEQLVLLRRELREEILREQAALQKQQQQQPQPQQPSPSLVGPSPSASASSSLSPGHAHALERIASLEQQVFMLKQQVIPHGTHAYLRVSTAVHPWKLAHLLIWLILVAVVCDCVCVQLDSSASTRQHLSGNVQRVSAEVRTSNGSHTAVCAGLCCAVRRIRSRRRGCSSMLQCGQAFWLSHVLSLLLSVFFFFCFLCVVFSFRFCVSFQRDALEAEYQTTRAQLLVSQPTRALAWETEGGTRRARFACRAFQHEDQTNRCCSDVLGVRPHGLCLTSHPCSLYLCSVTTSLSCASHRPARCRVWSSRIGTATGSANSATPRASATNTHRPTHSRRARRHTTIPTGALLLELPARRPSTASRTAMRAAPCPNPPAGAGSATNSRHHIPAQAVRPRPRTRTPRAPSRTHHHRRRRRRLTATRPLRTPSCRRAARPPPPPHPSCRPTRSCTSIHTNRTWGQRDLDERRLVPDSNSIRDST